MNSENNSHTSEAESVAVTLLFLLACAGILYLPQSAADGAREGVDQSLSVLLPSLFPFMFLCAFAGEYGISSKLGRLLSPFSRHVLHLPEEAGMVVLLSLVGGYPVGAAGICSLLDRRAVTHDQARRMLCFCVNPGPAFLIITVGEGLYGSTAAGWVLFAAQTAASLIIAVILGISSRRRKQPHDAPLTGNNRNDLSCAFVKSVKSACGAAVTLCSLVVLFSCFSTLLLTSLNVDSGSLTGIIIRAFLEVTDGAECIAAKRLPLYITSLAIGWGGICVHLQIFAALSGRHINKLRFAAVRLLSGALSMGITYLILRYIKTDISVFSEINNHQVKLSSTPVTGSLALLVSCIMFLIFITPAGEREYNI